MLGPCRTQTSHRAPHLRVLRHQRLLTGGYVAIDDLAGRLDALGQAHAGVHLASFGWILPVLLDPDGHQLRFYTIEHHTDPRSEGVTTINDSR